MKKRHKPHYVILIGPNTSGKTTQGRMLVKKIPGGLHTDMSSLIKARGDKDHKFRKMANDMIKNGGLLPCNTVSDLFRGHVSNVDYLVHLLTGFPRTLIQGVSFNSYMNETYGDFSYQNQVVVIENHVTEEVALIRARKRREEDIAAGREPRADDDPEVVTHRYSIYEMETYPLLHYFKEVGVPTFRIDASVSMDQVFSETMMILTGMSIIN